jgi:S-adenosylmethionine hydrolase
VLYVDRFGNVQLNLTRHDLEKVGIGQSSTLELEVGFERFYAVSARTFAEVRGGDIVLYEDAYWNISVAINRGNAAEMFGVNAGDELTVSAAEW